MDIQMLLQEITSVSKKYDLLNQRTGGYFNVFDIAGISSDEVMICRMIYELLSPEGSHCQGSLYLKLFFKHVLGQEMTGTEMGTARVYREYVIDEGRRIDLVIETSSRFIPIEVKIYSGDQDRQCCDYYREAEKHMQDPALYYLTRFGDNPSEQSAAGLTRTATGYKEIIPISFANHILTWLGECVRQGATIKIAPVREILLQLTAVIRRFTNQVEDEKGMEIREILMASPENMKSAAAVQNSINEAKEALMLHFFQAVDEKVSRKQSRIINEYDYTANNFKKLHEYYRFQRPSWPGISYRYKSSVKEDVDIWVRLEIDWLVYVGYCCPVRGKASAQPLTDEEISRCLGVEPQVENWWAYWEYCPRDGERSPDFKNGNEFWYELFDKKCFERFVNECAGRIEALLDRSSAWQDHPPGQITHITSQPNCKNK